MKHSLKQTVGKVLVVAAVGVAGLASVGAAQASNVSWSVGISLPPVGIVGGNVYPAPVYAPAPAYYPAPQVVYEAPPLVYRAPPRVYYPAPPVVYAPRAVVVPQYGWHGDRRWHDERAGYWHNGRYERGGWHGDHRYADRDGDHDRDGRSDHRR